MIDLNEYDALLRRAPRVMPRHVIAAQPETRATLLVECEQKANDLVVLLARLQSLTESGRDLATTIHLGTDARALATMLQELKEKVAS